MATQPMEAHMSQMIVKFKLHIKARLGEWFAACVLASVAVMLAVFPEMLDRGSIFRVMRTWGHGYMWALWLALMSFPRLGALYVNGRRKITPAIRAILSFFSAFAWGEISLSILLSGVPALAWAVFPWFVILEMFNLSFAMADARDVFDDYRAKRDGTRNAF